MHIATTQRGMTAIGWMTVLGLIAFVVLIVLRVGPLYMEYGKVSSILDNVKQEIEAAPTAPGKGEVVKMIEKRFEVNDVNRVKVDSIGVKRLENGGTELHLNYEARAPFLSNIAIVATFDKTWTATGTSR